MCKNFRRRNLRKKVDENYNFPGIVIRIVDAQKLLRLNPEEGNTVCLYTN